jgi:hypothetical protein
MYEVSVYPITPSLWRWEIRCGTAPIRVTAEIEATNLVNT